MVRKVTIFLLLAIVPVMFSCSKKTNVVYINSKKLQNANKVEISPESRKKIKEIVSDEVKLPYTKTKEIEKVVKEEKIKTKKNVESKVKKLLTPYKEEKIKKETALLKEPVTPVKLPDTIMRVLVLPYVDDKQAFHSSKYIFVKVEEGKWILGNYIHKDIKRKAKEYNPLVEVKQ